MNKLILVILTMILPISIYAQSKKYYCEVKGVEKELTAGLKIVFDFGNNPVYSAWGGLKSKQKLVDEKVMKSLLIAWLMLEIICLIKDGLFFKRILLSTVHKLLFTGFSQKKQIVRRMQRKES